MKIDLKHKYVVLMLILFVGILVFIFYIHQRGGKDFEEDFAHLAPIDTAMYTSANNIRGMMEFVSGLELNEQIANNETFASILMSSKQWNDFTKQKEKFESASRIRVTREFIYKWFGERLSFFMYKSAAADFTGLILITKADIGFEEKLAEFIAQIYPDLILRTSLYKGVKINLYSAKKQKNSFSYMRFGNVIVLSFQSDDLRYLEEIVDKTNIHAKKSLLENDSYKEFMLRNNQKRIKAYCNMAKTLEAIKYLPGKKKNRKKSSNEEALASIIPSVREIFLSADFMKNNFNISIEGNYKKPLPENVISTRQSDLLKYVNANTSAFLSVRGDASISGLKDIIVTLYNYKDFKEFTNLLMRKDDSSSSQSLLQLLKEATEKDFVFSIRDITPTALVPIFSVGIIGRIKNPESTKIRLSLLNNASQKNIIIPEEEITTGTAIATINSPIFSTYTSIDDDCLMISTRDVFIKEALMTKNDASNRIDQNSVYSNLHRNIKIPYDFMIFINFIRASSTLEAIADYMFLWDKDTRKKLGELRQYAIVLRYLQGAMIYSYIDGTVRKIELNIPLK